MEMRCMMPAFARDRPPSSLLNPSLRRWCCAAMLFEILPMNSSSSYAERMLMK
jgi:hypothetical protein